jgi:hypothetical protein
MEHLAEERLNALALDQASAAQDETDHLASCADCRTALEMLQLMAAELRVARHSEPSPAVRQRAYQFFDQIQQQPSWLERVVQRLQAQLLWDSRQQLAAQGLRTAAAGRYHLLYATDRLDVEISVQPQAGRLDLEGELLPSDPDGTVTPALVHLQRAGNSGVPYETRSDADGHFRFQGIASGQYTLLITPRMGVLLEIEGLELV